MDHVPTGAGWPIEIVCSDKKKRPFRDYDHLLGQLASKPFFLENQCMFLHSDNADHLNLVCPNYQRVAAIMEDSAGAPAHTITDNLSEGATEAISASLALPSSERRGRYTASEDEDNAELRDIGTEDDEPSPVQRVTLNSKNLTASESESDAVNCLRRRAPLCTCFRVVTRTRSRARFEGFSGLV